jgi:hypothetical protein
MSKDTIVFCSSLGVREIYNLQIYCGGYTLVVNDHETMKQHLLLGNKFLISKYTDLLTSNALVDRHVTTETIRVKY